MKFLHELGDANALFLIIAEEKKIDPYLVEKDYWIMHALWGLQQQAYNFELKGGTSLSKGFKIIDRFSEDIDICIQPPVEVNLPRGRNQNKSIHIDARKKYFDQLANEINIHGMHVVRDNNFDNPTLMSAGIRLNYNSLFNVPVGVKQGVLLEAGFDNTTPNEEIDIDSWALSNAASVITDIIDNRALKVKCYLPEYTFVEKLQTITRKVRQQQERREFEVNFLRHFYDIHQLFQQKRIVDFIGTKLYENHKILRFRGDDSHDLKKNLAFNLDSNRELFEQYKAIFKRARSLFISEPPTFDEIYASIIQIREIG